MVIIISFDPLHFGAISYNFSFLISDFIYLGPPCFVLFFLVSLDNGLSIVFMFLKTQILVLLIFAIFLASILFISALIFVIFYQL